MDKTADLPPATEPTGDVDLSQFNNAWFERGASRLTEAVWIGVQAVLVSSWLPGSRHRCALLRLFGAKIGEGVQIKPGVRVKFPWKLTVGAHSWIGEGVWIDNLATVQIGANCCLSQGAYLCTGSHDWRLRTFDLITKPIVVGDSAWVAAQAVIGPGVTVGRGAVLSLGAIAATDLAPWTVYQGNPAKPIRRRDMPR